MKKIILCNTKLGRYYIRLETGFKTCLRANKATRFDSHDEAYRWMKSEGLSSEFVSSTEVDK